MTKVEFRPLGDGSGKSVTMHISPVSDFIVFLEKILTLETKGNNFLAGAGKTSGKVVKIANLVDLG